MAEGNIVPPKYDFKGHRDPDNVIDVNTSDEEIDDNTSQRRVQEQMLSGHLQGTLHLYFLP